MFAVKTFNQFSRFCAVQTALALSAAVPLQVSAGSKVCVATYNIRCAVDKGTRSWDVRLPLLKDVILSRGFDIVGMQEVLPGQLKDLKETLTGWSSAGLGRNADRKGEASPIFWKTSKFKLVDSGEFWLSENPAEPGSKSWKAAFPRICTWVKLRPVGGGKEFYFFNTHMDHKSVAARKHSARLIMERMSAIAKDAPVVFTGDFNDEIGSDEYRAEVRAKDRTILSPSGPDHPIEIVSRKLKDSRKISRTPPKGTVWTDNGYGEKHVKRIDYIFVSDGIVVEDFETCFDRPQGLYPSDHEAVSAHLVMP